MKHVVFFFRLAVFASLFAVASYLSVARSQAVATLESPDMLMGNTGRLRVSVPLPNDSTPVDLPILREAELQKRKFIPFLNDTIELLVNHKRALEVSGDRVSMRYDLLVQAFDSGTYVIPALEFLVGGEKVTSNPVELTVLPVKVKADDKLDDFSTVADPFELNPNPDELEEESATLVWWIVGIIVLILILIIVSYILYRKNGSIFTPSKPKTPSELALERLSKLRKDHLVERGRVKDYYTRLTDIERAYLHSQFGIKTLEKTSAEILSQIEADDNLSDYSAILRPIFETSDFVKFAKVSPSAEESSRLLDDAVRFVELSTPHADDSEGKGGGK